MMLTIEDAIRVLRGYKGEQIVCTLITHSGARCAVGVLGGEELGMESGAVAPIFQGISGHDRNAILIDLRIAACYGLHAGEVDMIEIWNDNDKLSFVEIADRLEEYAREQVSI